VYKCCWNYFIQKEEKRDILGLLKSIFKSEKYINIPKSVKNVKKINNKDSNNVFIVFQLIKIYILVAMTADTQ